MYKCRDPSLNLLELPVLIKLIYQLYFIIECCLRLCNPMLNCSVGWTHCRVSKQYCYFINKYCEGWEETLTLFCRAGSAWFCCWESGCRCVLVVYISIIPCFYFEYPFIFLEILSGWQFVFDRTLVLLSTSFNLYKRALWVIQWHNHL